MNPFQGENTVCFLTVAADFAVCPVNAVLHLFSSTDFSTFDRIKLVLALNYQTHSHVP